MIAFALFAASISLLFGILIIKRYDIKQVHWLFFALMLLYNVFPYLYLKGYHPDFVKFYYSLVDSDSISDTRLFISSSCITTYIFCIFIFKRKEYFRLPSFPLASKFTFNPSLFFILIYPISLYFSYHYKWQDIPLMGAQLGHSVAAHLKNLLLVLFVVISADKNKVTTNAAFVLYVILAIIDTQRTNLFIVCIVYFLFNASRSIVKNIVIVAAAMSLIVFIGLNRIGMDYDMIFYPFYTEAVFGSYCISQSIEIVNNLSLFESSLSLIASPLIDFVIKIIPNIYFETFFYCNKSYLLDAFTSAMYEKRIILEEYMPMGGAFFPAESHMLLPYIGPVLFTIIFFYYLYWVVRIRDGYLKVILYSTPFAILKATSLNAMKFVLSLVLMYFLLRLFDRFCRGIKNCIFSRPLGDPN